MTHVNKMLPVVKPSKYMGMTKEIYGKNQSYHHKLVFIQSGV